jgi:hypothetical protein
MTANEHVTSFSEGVGKPLLLTEEDIGMVKYEKTEKTFLMIDLETVGLRGNIPILSMGACAYIKGAGIFQTFYSVFDLQEQLDSGRRIDTELVTLLRAPSIRLTTGLTGLLRNTLWLIRSTCMFRQWVTTSM